MSLQTTFEFQLPRGYLDAAGQLHRDGTMRLATALDEIDIYNHPRVQENEAYLPVALLSRVVVRLGELSAVTPAVIEGLFASDLAYLEDLYERVNSPEPVIFEAICPSCSAPLQVQVNLNE